jgi:integrase
MFTGDDDYVFVQDTGELLGYDWSTRRFKLARDAANLTAARASDDPLTFHDLRHSYGTLAAAIYQDLRCRSNWGHASITTTEIYAHLSRARTPRAKGSAGLNAMLAPTGLAREGEIVAA